MTFYCPFVTKKTYFKYTKMESFKGCSRLLVNRH